MSVPFSSVLPLRKSPNLVRDPVSPASLSRGASASSSAWTASHHRHSATQSMLGALIARTLSILRRGATASLASVKAK